jgi:hypothetical protein
MVGADEQGHGAASWALGGYDARGASNATQQRSSDPGAKAERRCSGSELRFATARRSPMVGCAAAARWSPPPPELR